ncbi:hypothetical protein LCL95_02105 [Bacillus timonensis]|nr:hypothetical protein [Bacillus timonensis]
MKINEPKRPQLLFVLIMVLIVAVVSSPFWLWQLKSSKTLEVLIIDKTVPDETYREHKGLMWILNHLKYIQGDGTTYHLKKDYVGFYPKKNQEYGIREIPSDLKSYPLIYLADGYGVYEEEFYEENLEGKRSNIIYGGMTAEDVEIIEKALYENNPTFIAEFNTFASPTEEEVKKDFYKLLNISWTGWIGRFFEDLESVEVPVWVKDNYEKQSGESYAFTGEGYVFVDRNDQVVILDGKEVTKEGVLFQFTKQGEEHFQSYAKVSYNYWFDIVSPVEEKDVLATYTLSVTKKGEEKLNDAGIPTIFPAVTQYKNTNYTSYYFSGDYADQGELPNIYQTVGFTKLKQWFSPDQSLSTLPFYWKAYVPMMNAILHEVADGKKEESKTTLYEKEGIKVVGQTSTDYLQVYQNGTWEDLLIKGVNMGIAKPGSWPGETAISKEEYYRWFKQIGEMNANAIRVYTIHPPEFYEAFYEYNQARKSPLYLFHGVWLNEETFLETNDALSEENTSEFKEEIKRIVDIIHGNASIAEKRGHASGTYTANISPYVLGYILGVEWDPSVVLATNEKHQQIEDYKGKFIETKGATAFETWLAQMMDYTIDYETTEYKTQRLLSFTNWPTTDLLDHPSEPLVNEDMVSVNPNVIYQTENLHSGIFASYHFYPYYPDFLNYDKNYINYIDHRGEKNNYAGYLNHMKEVHSMPILVAEFGVPGSRGLTHRNVYGMDQGHHSEDDQGRIDTKLYEDIYHEKMAGGLLFTWQDEWFKRTWNTMDYDDPNRRPYWSNAQTNEQQFGLLSFDPAQSYEKMIKIDGDASDWEKNKISSAISNKVMKDVYVSSDERYLHIRLDYEKGYSFKNENIRTSILFDTINDQGQSAIPNVNNVTTSGVDFVLELNGENNSQLLIDSYYDTFYYDYGHVLNMIETDPIIQKKDNGKFHPIRLALNKKLEVTDKTGQTIFYPFDYYETGKMKFGNADPKDKQYDSLTDISSNRDGTIVEARIPWMLLNVKDPSTRTVIGDIWSEGGISNNEEIEGIRIGYVIANINEGNIIEAFPQPDKEKTLNSSKFYQYSWPIWEQPTYHERLKQSYYYMKDLFNKLGK